jgi:hypothetical protein
VGKIALGTGIAAMGGTFAASYFKLKPFLNWYKKWWAKAKRCDDMIEILVQNIDDQMKRKVMDECQKLNEKTVEENKWYFLEILAKTIGNTKYDIIRSLRYKVSQQAVIARAATREEVSAREARKTREEVSAREARKLQLRVPMSVENFDLNIFSSPPDVSDNTATTGAIVSDNTATTGAIVSATTGDGVSDNTATTANGAADVPLGGGVNLTTEKQILYMCILILYLEAEKK